MLTELKNVGTDEDKTLAIRTLIEEKDEANIVAYDKHIEKCAKERGVMDCLNDKLAELVQIMSLMKNNIFEDSHTYMVQFWTGVGCWGWGGWGWGGCGVGWGLGLALFSNTLC